MVHQGVGGCDTTLNDVMWDAVNVNTNMGQCFGRQCLIADKTAEACWSACQLAHPTLQAPRHTFWIRNDGDQMGCYCQEGCPPCMTVRL